MSEEQTKREPWYDEDKVDEMALALLRLTAFQQRKDEPWRAWKGWLGMSSTGSRIAA